MKNDIIKKSKQIAIPNNTQRKKVDKIANQVFSLVNNCLLYTSPSPRDRG